MIFIFKSAITLALLYCCFFAFLSKETFHRFNRVALLGIVIASLLVPFIHITTTHPTIVNETVARLQDEFNVVEKKSIATQTISFTWSDWVIIGYMLGVAIMVVVTLVQIVLLVRNLSGGLRHTDKNGNTVILKTGDTSPFSFLKYIVMSVKDYENSREYILTHEQEHIRLGHSYDILLIEAVKIIQWFNPFIWFLGRDLQAVHEYEADQAVINQGIDAKSYQQLLVIKAVGDRLQPFTNNLRRGSLKQRITMMYQKKSSRWMMLKALCAIPVASLTIAAFAQPQTIERMEQAIAVAETQIASKIKATVIPTETPTPAQEKTDETTSKKSTGHVTEKKETAPEVYYGNVEIQPEFPGGSTELRKFLATQFAGIEGDGKRHYVSFRIDSKGNVQTGDYKILNPSTEEIDKAIGEAITAMPKWIPGRLADKNVACVYTLPIELN